MKTDTKHAETDTHRDPGATAKPKPRSPDLVCLGILVLDAFGKPIDRFPEKGTSDYFDTLEIHRGGCAYNTGVSASRLGMAVAVLGKVGTDHFGAIMGDGLEHEGVDTAGIVRSADAPTAFSFIMVPEDGQRRIYHTMGVNATYGPADVPRDIIAGARVFHVAGGGLLPRLDGEPTVELLRFARANGALTSLDPVVRPGIAESILPCLPYLDVFLPNADESAHITGLTEPEDQLEFFRERGGRIVGIKNGSRGCLVSDGRHTLRLGIYDVPVKDTSGAGDAFVAGFLYGIVHGWSLERCARFATATAAFCVQAIGTTTAIPSSARVLEFMRENRVDETAMKPPIAGIEQNKRGGRR